MVYVVDHFYCDNSAFVAEKLGLVQVQKQRDPSNYDLFFYAIVDGQNKEETAWTQKNP